MIHLIAQCVLYLTKCVFEFAFFSYPTTKALSGVLGRYESGHTCITYIAKSKTEPQRDTSHTLWSRRVSVWKNIPNSKYFWYCFVSWLSLLNECLLESMGYLYFFLFFSLSFFLGGYLSTHCFILWTLVHFFSHSLDMDFSLLSSFF
jgi:hypothetical protein